MRNSLMRQSTQRVLLGMLGLLLAAGCSERESNAKPPPPPFIDYSSESEFTRSLAVVKASLNDEKRKELEISLIAIAFALEDTPEEMISALHGKSAAEIVEYAKALE